MWRWVRPDPAGHGPSPASHQADPTDSLFCCVFFGMGGPRRRRWLDLALLDLEPAEQSLMASRHEWACFPAHQAVEKGPRRWPGTCWCIACWSGTRWRQWTSRLAQVLPPATPRMREGPEALEVQVKPSDRPFSPLSWRMASVSQTPAPTPGPPKPVTTPIWTAPIRFHGHYSNRYCSRKRSKREDRRSQRYCLSVHVWLFCRSACALAAAVGPGPAIQGATSTG
jgi:hypothetical protein